MFALGKINQELLIFVFSLFLSENSEEIESINENDYFAPKTLLNHQNLYG